MQQARRLKVLVTIGIGHTECTHMKCVPIDTIVLLKPLERHGIPDPIGSRVLNDEEPLVVNLVFCHFLAEFHEHHRGLLLCQDLRGRSGGQTRFAGPLAGPHGDPLRQPAVKALRFH